MPMHGHERRRHPMMAPTPRSWTAPTVLVVDDDAAVRRFISRALAREAITVHEAPNVEQALELVAAERPDLVLLDVMLEGASGFDALPRFREMGLPVILVTGRDAVTDKVLGLELGADDYVAKPFDPRELASRVRAVLRRAQAAPPTEGRPDRSVHGALVIDRARREILVDDRSVELTTREFDLLVYLADRSGRVCSRDELLEQVWHSSPEWQNPGTVTEHVRRIRTKIEPDPAHPRWIHTTRGVGYRFDA
ncbi:MAG: response regulator transcription factor [Acidimicrobiia bacterium]|jgi:DNA-binding response OmpR family regulator